MNNFQKGGVAIIIVVSFLMVASMLAGVYFYFDRQLTKLPTISGVPDEEELAEIETGDLTGEQTPEDLCQNECSTFGERTCIDKESYHICSYDAQNCRKWSPAISCIEDAECQNGDCVKISLETKPEEATEIIQCSSGPCCNLAIQEFRPASYICYSKARTEFDCPWGNQAGSDVGIRYQNRYCSGLSANCNGELKWSNWAVHKTCSTDEKCENGECVALKCADGTSYGQCSGTKPKYCDDGNLVDKCSICGCLLSQDCDKFSELCIPPSEITPLGKKRYILYNGPPNKKLDILFIPQNVSDISTLRSKIDDILYKTGKNINGLPMVSLLNTEPFKSYKSKFNVSYIDKNIDESLFGCWKPEPDPTKPPETLHFLCNDDKVKEGYEIFEPDYIIVLFNEPGYGSSGGETQYLSINLESSSDFAILGSIFVHEFGHQFGGLADAYVTTGSPSYHCGTTVSSKCFENYEKALEYYPNLDTLGCPKWCQSYDINKDTIFIEDNKLCGVAKNMEECKELTEKYFGACTWFESKHPFFNSHCVATQGGGNIGINCESDAGCYFGGDYGQLAFHPGASMMAETGGGGEFDAISKKHLDSILNCCYPRKETNFCNNFRNKFRDIPSSASLMPDLRTALNKIFLCP